MKSRETTVTGSGEELFADGERALQPCDGRGEHELCVETELLGEFRTPLFGEARRAEDRKALNRALGEQFARDQPCFHRLSNADVIGDQQAHGLLTQPSRSGTSW